MSASGSERVTRTRAGSSKPVSKPKRKQIEEPVVEEDESDDFTAAVVDGDGAEENEVMEVDPPRGKPAARAVNGKSAAKGKGKAKTDSAPAKKPSSRADVEVIDDDDEDAGPPGTARAINNATVHNRATKLPGRAESSTAAAKKIDHLTRQLESANANIQDLKKQLEESYRVRHTEAEELQRRQVEKYEEIIKTKDLLLKQQEEMLSRKEPLSKEGKTSVLHMVTREHADAEKRSAEEQVTYWKDQVAQRDQLLQEKEEEIVGLQQIQSDLQYEIKAERENSQKASRNPPSVQRSRGPQPLLGSDDPKHSELVQFYEDITNLLVTDIKIQEPKYFDLDEWALTCIYTYADKSGSEKSKRSLAFFLRFTYDPLDPSAPVESAADLDRAAQYTPMDLDKESAEFTDALDFLNRGFAFPRKQLPLFFSSLVDNMKAACEEPGSDADNESMEDVQLVE
ncbi:hypothetical protein C8R44DRAFT_819819 [Mycena epipterygia]|nr:hypothetical protein C8R44DRAFT_819819 [Mycena epipterygia]